MKQWPDIESNLHIIVIMLHSIQLNSLLLIGYKLYPGLDQPEVTHL
jgi:hypothetical protein